ncbi:MAG: hypothetical protein HY721_01300 [Planctomycetes bacterium]|nr:hypothetical protein [Planctomycetota bacterium]
MISPDGRLAHLGSWRASGGFLADLLNHELKTRRFDYMDFYMGSSGLRWPERVSLFPVYAMVFRRLKALGFEWKYEFPRIHVVDLRPLREALEAGEPDWTGYLPSEEIARAAEDDDRERQLSEVRESLEEGHRESLDRAKRDPPPETVRAYREVYGSFPQGWPPWEE